MILDWHTIDTAPNQEKVLVGSDKFLGWHRIAIQNAMGEWIHCDRPYSQQDKLDQEPTHWMRISCVPKPSQAK